MFQGAHKTRGLFSHKLFPVCVETAKNGPIYDVAWSPNSAEFCVVYGFMPAKATIFNLKCDPVFDFGTGPRNAAYYRWGHTCGFLTLTACWEPRRRWYQKVPATIRNIFTEY